MKKRLILMNPGPVNVTPGVRRALLGPDICHREKEFSDVLKSVRSNLLGIFGVRRSHAVAVLTGSGTAALEAMLGSFSRKDKKILVLSNGVYGERICQILERYGSPVVRLSSEIGSFPDKMQIEKAIQTDASIHAVAMVHHETSSGMLNPLKPVSDLCKKYSKFFLVDAVSSLGAETIDLKTIDYCAGSAGKCLHAFPGLAFVFVSHRGASYLSDNKPKSLYLDLLNTLRHEENEDTPFTPAVQLFYAFDAALKELARQGLSSRIRDYARRSAALEAGFQKMSLRFLIEKKYRSHVLTSLWLPDNLSYELLHRKLKKKGFVIYAGQSKLAGKIFRISNLGSMSLRDIARFLRVLKQILKKSHVRFQA